MAMQIALNWSEDTAEELERLGFKKIEVYYKAAPVVDVHGGESVTEAQKRAGDAEFFSMAQPPFQFVTTSFWGASHE